MNRSVMPGWRRHLAPAAEPAPHFATLHGGLRDVIANLHRPDGEAEESAVQNRKRHRCFPVLLAPGSGAGDFQRDANVDGLILVI